MIMIIIIHLSSLSSVLLSPIYALSKWKPINSQEVTSIVILLLKMDNEILEVLMCQAKVMKLMVPLSHKVMKPGIQSSDI